MATQTLNKHRPISRYFLVTALYLSLIVLISGCYASAKEKDKEPVPVAAAVVLATPVDGATIKPHKAVGQQEYDEVFANLKVLQAETIPA